MTAVKNALDVQTGGSHYKDMAIQPAEYIHANGIGFLEGNNIKYVSRWRKKGGIQDLRKAIHVLEMLIELEEAKQPKPSAEFFNDGSAAIGATPGEFFDIRQVAPTPTWPWPNAEGPIA